MDNDNSWSFHGKVVLVTGGAAGIGASLVRTLLCMNARVCRVLFKIRFI